MCAGPGISFRKCVKLLSKEVNFEQDNAKPHTVGIAVHFGNKINWKKI